MKVIKNIELVADNVFGKYYLKFLMIIVIFLIINYLRVEYVLVKNWNGWAVGDWIINYDYGFTRRGLSGEIVKSANFILKLDTNWIVYLIQNSFYILFLVFFILQIRKKIITYWFFVMCLLPGALLFTYYDGMAVGRKEAGLLALYSIWIYQINRKLDIKIAVIFSVVIFIFTLIHEVFFFYSMYFIFSVYFLNNLKKEIKNSIIILIASASAIWIIIFFGHEINSIEICNDLIKSGMNKEICNGIFSYEMQSPIVVMSKYIEDFNYRNIFQIIIIIVSIELPIIFTLYSNEQFRNYRFKFLLFSSVVILISYPLFILAEDWGRWISIHVMLTIMTLSLHLRDKSVNQDAVINNNNNNNKMIYLFVAILIIVLSTFGYSYQHCCSKDFINLYGPIKKIESIFKNRI